LGISRVYVYPLLAVPQRRQSARGEKSVGIACQPLAESIGNLEKYRKWFPLTILPFYSSCRAASTGNRLNVEIFYLHVAAPFDPIEAPSQLRLWSALTEMSGPNAS
jgi:hypothetical protein